ncbi:protein of unknown function [Candidatus Nitrotoga arctica]|uniref:Uncharacterized protein n=1 Tax=Candidatus Nitrotoga arctica TaxID=453162 RepID=A0ABM8Z2W0_9PROT|nr:protein of unknown function [Candidatus Nitrotoga arctica]
MVWSRFIYLAEPTKLKFIVIRMQAGISKHAFMYQESPKIYIKQDLHKNEGQ